MTAIPAPPASPVTGPVRLSDRALAPDLARGAMLALIALANAPYYFHATATGVGIHLQGGSVLDRIVRGLLIAGVDGRVYPMFAALFGFGVASLVARQRAAGTAARTIRRGLRRRHLVMIAFGVVHQIVLFPGDIVAVYGVTGLLFGWLALRSDKTVVITAAVAMVPPVLLLSLLLLSPATATSTASLLASPSEPDAVTALSMRAAEGPMLALLSVLGTPIVACTLIGMWSARRRLLTEPARHRRALVIISATGISVGWAGGLPLGLAGTGLWQPTTTTQAAVTLLHSLSGVAAGLGYAAVFGLLALRLHARRSQPVRVMQAVGQRSLSCYLAQSVIMAPLLAAWGIGLGAHLGDATMALASLAVWLLIALLACLDATAGGRGPAETLLRRLAYPRTARRPTINPPATHLQRP